MIHSDKQASSRRRLTRRLGVVTGILGTVGIAGCTSDEDVDEAGTPDPTPTPTPTQTPKEGVTPGFGDPTPTPTPTPPDNGGSTPDGECSQDTISALESDRDQLEQQIDDLKFTHESELQEYETISLYRDQMESGFSEETVSQATDIGLMARDAVVIIEQLDAGGQGTGWFVEPDLILTNSHNVQSGEEHDLQAKTIDGSEISLSIVDYVADEIPDVALVQTEGYEHDVTLSLGSEADLESEQPLVQNGHPGGIGYWVTSLGQFVSLEEYGMEGGTYNELVTLVPGIEGVSGSPLLNLDGEVVAMTYGGQPLLERDPNEPAPVIPDRVFDSPIGHITSALHVGADVMSQLKEEWK